MTRRLLTIALVAALAMTSACSSTKNSESTATTAVTATSAAKTVVSDKPLTVLLTNDDGIGAPGLDAMAKAIKATEGLELVIFAPAENQSGKGDSTSPGPVTFAEGKTRSGLEGTAVGGTPADSVVTALDDKAITPEIVVSGINSGQNVGPLVKVSGTVGAALTAARRGVPAIAVSAGLTADADFAGAADLAVQWILDHRAELAAHKGPVESIVNLNMPQCTAGKAREVVDVSIAAAIPEKVNPFVADCSAPAGAKPTNDVDAIARGYIARSTVPIS